MLSATAPYIFILLVQLRIKRLVKFREIDISVLLLLYRRFWILLDFHVCRVYMAIYLPSHMRKLMQNHLQKRLNAQIRRFGKINRTGGNPYNGPGKKLFVQHDNICFSSVCKHNAVVLVSIGNAF